MAAKLFFLPYQTATINAIAAPGATLTFLSTGTTTPLPIYTTSALTTTQTNPVVANGAGKFPDVYLDSTKIYRLIIEDKNGAVLQDIDPYVPGTAPDASSLQPYADDAAASAVTASSASATATTEAGIATTQAGIATTQAGIATTQAGIATTEAGIATAAVASVSSIPNATAHAATRTVLAGLNTSGGPAYLTEAGREGTFVFDSSNLSALVTIDTAQGIYVAPASDTTGASGAWVRKFSGKANVLWWGAVADDATDTSAKIQAAIDTLKALKMTGTEYGYGFGSLGLFVPAQRKAYYIASQIVVDHTLVIEFDGGGGAAGGSAVWRAPDGAGAIRFTVNAAGSIIERPMLYGGYGAVESEHHGIEAWTKVTIIEPKIFNFPGDGIYGEPSANTNDTSIIRPFIQGCRTGAYFEGSNANALLISQPQMFLNRRYGVWLNGTIGSTLIGGDYSTNGNSGNSICTFSGKWYYVLPGQETGASTNAPSGTTANNTWWGFLGTGAADGTRPAWVSGMTWRAGGTIRVDGGSSYVSITGGYAEPDQPPMQMQGHVLISAPNMGIAVGGDGTPFGGQIYNADDGPQFPATLRIGNDKQDPSATGLTVSGNLTLTPPAGYTFDPIITVNSTNVAASLALNVNGTNKATIQYNGSNDALNFITSGLGSGFILYNTNAAAALTNLIFQNTAGSHNIRYERRGGASFLAPSSQNTVYEFQIGTAGAGSTIIGDGGIYTSQAIKAGGAVTGSNLSGTNTGDQTITLTGDVTGSGTGSFAATIGAAKVTLAKIANAAANSKLLGSGAAGSGASYAELTLGTGLTMSGTTLNGNAGTVTTASVTTANGVSGSVATATTTPAITITLGAITPTSVAATGALTSSSATAGIGYATGAGGTVSQATSKSTGVTLSKASGQITMNAAALASAAVVSFIVTNTVVAATDTINLNLQSGNTTAGTYRYWIDKVSAGSFVIAVENRSAGSLSEALVLNFAVVKAVAA